MNDQQKKEQCPECEIKRSVRQWISIGRPPMPARSQASEPAVDAAAVMTFQDGKAFKDEKCESRA